MNASQSNSGVTEDNPVNGTSRRRVPLGLVLLFMGAAIVVAALILARVAGPLYALLFPVEVPVPAQADVIEHVEAGNGPEYWVYRTTMTGEEVVQFYEREGSICRRSPVPDYVTDPTLPFGGPYSVATCQGQKESAGLGVSWEVFIHEGYVEEVGPTIFRLYKYGEVN